MDTPELPVRPKMSGGLVPGGQIVEAAIRAFRRALAREHARRILFLAAIRVHAAGVRKRARQVFVLQEVEDLAPALEFGRGEFGDLRVAQRLRVVGAAHFTASHGVRVFGRGHAALPRGPRAHAREPFGADVFQRAVVRRAKRVERRIPGGRGWSGGERLGKRGVTERLQR
jgi:hypothetical protein